MYKWYYKGKKYNECALINNQEVKSKRIKRKYCGILVIHR